MRTVLLALLSASPMLAVSLGAVSGVYLVRWGESMLGLIPLMGLAVSIGIAAVASIIVHDELTRGKSVD